MLCVDLSAEVGYLGSHSPNFSAHTTPFTVNSLFNFTETPTVTEEAYGYVEGEEPSHG